MKLTKQPKDSVLSAYEAANRGLYSKANSFVAPHVRKELVRSHALTVQSGKRLRRTLQHFRGRRDAAAKRGRTTILALIKSNRAVASLRLGSPRFFRDLWNCATRGRSLRTIEATRQVIRRPHARVYLKLTLRDGRVVRDSEPVVLRRGKWLLG